MTFRWMSTLALLGLFICASAACGPECPEGQTKCGEVCKDLQIDRANCGACDTKCEDGQACNAGKCEVTCQDGLTDCEGTCADTKTDNSNCGACGTACQSGEQCVDGKCGTTCADGLKACGSACINTDTDVNNCGDCDTKCKAGEVCNSGKCEVVCQDGQKVCNGACVDPQSDVANCGDCDKKCDAGTVCNAGKCETSCQKDLSDCSGSCVNLKTSEQHCGACGTVCKSGERCTDGKCELNCGDDFANCNDVCINIKTSRDNCGACDTKCETGERCNAGKCEVSCQDGLTSCDNKCVNTDTDGANCGTCGTKCADGEVCAAGKCEFNCNPGFTNCGGTCYNLNGDSNNCGKCGTKCATGESCYKGKCETTATTCLQGETACGSGCYDLKSDTANCGGCGIACNAGDVCLNGACTKCTDCPNFAAGFGSYASDYLRDLAVDKDGNIYIVGEFYELSSFDNVNIVGDGTSADIFVAKLNPSGKTLWAKRAGGDSTDYGYGIAVDSKGNVYITGGFQSGTKGATFGTTKLSATGSYDIYVAALDKDGKWLWAKAYGSSSGDYGYDIAVDSKDNVVVTGYFYSSVAFGTTTLSSKGSADVFVMQYDSTGKITWAGSAGGTSTDYGYGIAVDSSDNVYVTGYFNGTVNLGLATLSSNGSGDVFVAKFDSKGTLGWANSGGGGSSDYGRGITVDSTGNVYITGNIFTSSSKAPIFGSTTLAPAGSNDIFVAALDNKGKWTWAKVYGGSSSEYGYRVAVDSKNNVFVTGYFSGAKFGDIQLGSNGTDAYLLQLDGKTGDVKGATNIGGSSSDYGYGLAVDSKDNIFLGGYGQASMSFGKLELVQRGGNDLFVAKYPARATEAFCPSTGYTFCNNKCTNIASNTTNCGACNTICQSGQLCSAGKCLTPQARIYMKEVNTGAPDYVVITNNTTKDIDLSTVWIFNSYSGTSFSGAYFHEALPQFILKAGASVYCVESSPQTGEIKCPSMPWVSSDDFTLMLCLGKCDEKSNTNVLDFLQAGTSARFVPPGVTFSPGGMTNPPSDSSSYFQLPLQGKNPTYFKSDWSIGPKTR